MKTIFSIIIPVYRVERYLKECIQSVLNQVYRGYEIILVDDGSPDSCPIICDEYKNNYPNIIKVVHKENGGLSDARNCGTIEAKGDYIVYLDSDDYWDSNNLLLDLANEIEAGHQPDVVLFQGKKLFESSGHIIKDPQYNTEIINSLGKNETVAYLIKSQTYSMSACTKAIKRFFLIETGISFEKGLLGEDLDWFFQVIFGAQTISAINNCCYVYRIREGSITTSQSIKNEEDQIKIITRWKSRILKSPIQDKYKKDYLAILAYAYMVALLNYGKLSKNDRTKIFLDLNNMKNILSYAENRKSKATYIFSRLFGIKITSYLLNIYYSIARH